MIPATKFAPFLVIAVLGLYSCDIRVAAMPPDLRSNMRAEMGQSTTERSLDTADSFQNQSNVEDFIGVTNLPKRKIYNCTESHRPHENDTNKFQVQHNYMWLDQVCQTGLVWNQTLCRCEYSPTRVEGKPQCPDYRPHAERSGKYEQTVNGIWVVRDCNLAVSGLLWNQTSCRCEWGPDGEGSLEEFERSTPCDTMLNVTFEHGLIDDAKSSFLELTSGSSVALRHYKTRTGELNKAAYFQDATMTVWYFAGNELGGSLRVELSFKAEDSPQTRDRYQIIISNGCNVTGLGYTMPSLAIGYRASDSSFLLALHTTNVRKAIVCTRNVESFSWHHVSMIYEDGTLLFRVDNHPCIISNEFSGDVQKTTCPLTIGSDPLERESKYIGYIDDLVVARYCRRFVEQPFAPEDNKDTANKQNVQDGRKDTNHKDAVDKGVSNKDVDNTVKDSNDAKNKEEKKEAGPRPVEKAVHASDDTAAEKVKKNIMLEDERINAQSFDAMSALA